MALGAWLMAVMLRQQFEYYYLYPKLPHILYLVIQCYYISFFIGGGLVAIFPASLLKNLPHSVVQLVHG